MIFMGSSHTNLEQVSYFQARFWLTQFQSGLEGGRVVIAHYAKDGVTANLVRLVNQILRK
jgi:hypothetical protein